MTEVVALAAADAVRVLAVLTTSTSDPVPDDNHVVAGWVGFVVMMLLIVAVVFILRSFTKQLRKVEAAQRSGVYDEKPEDGSKPPTTHVEQDR